VVNDKAFLLLKGHIMINGGQEA